MTGMARSVTALSRRRPEDGSPGPCPPDSGWGFSLTFEVRKFRCSPILGCASDLYLPQLR